MTGGSLEGGVTHPYDTSPVPIEHPWAVHLTISPKRGVGTLSSFSSFKEWFALVDRQHLPLSATAMATEVKRC